MNLDMTRNRSTRRPSFQWLQILLMGSGALALLLLVDTDPDTTPNAAPITQLPQSGIMPSHALLQLAGDPAEALAYQALNAGELDLAFTIVAYAVEIPPENRLPILLQLGRRYAANRQEDAARLAFGQARSLVVTTPELNGLARSQAMLQVAEGLLNIEAEDQALDAAIQVTRIVQQTPDLLPAQRSQIFDNLRALAAKLGNDVFSDEVNALARNPYVMPSGILLMDRWQSWGEPIAQDPDVANAIAQRGQAARALADRYALTGGVDVEPERQTLAAALQAEDQARGAAYQRSISAGLSLNQQVYLLQERRAWLALKLRIANRGFGLSIVPEWEDAATVIQQEFAAITNNLLNVAEALINGEADPATQAALRAANLVWLAQQTESGLYRDRTLNELSEQLRFAQSEMVRLGAAPALPVVYVPTASPPGLRIVPLSLLQ